MKRQKLMTALATLGLLFLFYTSLFRPFTSIGGIVTPGAFSLMVTLEFQDLAAKNEFEQLIQPLMAYVKDHEPTTIAYEILWGDKADNELKALLIERYRDKDQAYLKIHKSSAEFLHFRPQLQAMQDAGRVTVTGQSFVDSGQGFVGRK